MNNLTEEQKNSLRWIVQKIRGGELAEMFDCVFFINGKCARFQGQGSKITEEIPLNEGILQTLEASKLIFIERKEKTVWRCGILGNKAYEMVDSDFVEIDNSSLVSDTDEQPLNIEKYEKVSEEVYTLYKDLLKLMKSASLSKTLPMALQLARLIKKEDFEKWLRLEIGGYFNDNSAMSHDVKVPNYRNVSGQHLDRYNCPVLLPSKLQFMNSIPLRNGIDVLEKLANKTEMLIIQDSVSIEFFKENFETEIFYFRFDPLEINGVLGSIKIKLHDWLFEIQNTYPNLSKPIKIMKNQKKSSYEHFSKIIVSVILLGFALIQCKLKNTNILTKSTRW